ILKRARCESVSHARVSQRMGNLIMRESTELPRMARITLMTRNSLVLGASALLVGATACHRSVVVTSPGVAANVAPQAGWRSLFDGKTLDAWRAYGTQTTPRGWTVADGIITKQRGAQDLVSREQFGNFELELEWKIGEAGNSGIFYRGTEEY